MKHKSTLALLGAVIVAGVVAYVLSEVPSSEELAEKRTRVLPDFVTEKIGTLEIETAGTTITCVRDRADESKWFITAPSRLRADRYEVEGIISRFEAAETTGRPIRAEKATTLNPADYGLDAPLRRATFREADPSGRSWELLIGKDAPMGGLVYAAPPDRTVVYTIDKSVADRLDVAPNDLRSKKLTETVDTSDLKAVRIEAAAWEGKEGFALVCERKAGRWELREPVQDLADAITVLDLADEINGHALTRDDFVSDDPDRAGDYGLDRPALAISLELGTGTRRIVVSRRKEDKEETFYAMDEAESSIVRVPKGLFERLRKEPDEFRERTLVRLLKDDVTEIRITGAGGTLELERTGEQWAIAGEEPAAADGPTIGSLLAGLEHARVLKFVADEPKDPATYGLNEQDRLEVVLKDANDTTLVRLYFGADEGSAEHFYAQRPDYPAVLLLKKEPFVADLRRGRLGLLDRLVLKEPERQAVEVELVRGEEVFRCSRKDGKAPWKLQAPVAGPADELAVGHVAAVFGGLRAEGLVAESFDDPARYGLAAPSVIAMLTYRLDEDESRTYVQRLLVGSESREEPPGIFAQLDGDPRVFVLAQDVVDCLMADLASRTICLSDNIEGMEFRWEGGALSAAYDRETRRWKRADGGEFGKDLSEKVARAAVQLRNFRGEKVVAYLEKDPSRYGFEKPALVVELKEGTAEGKTVVIGKEAPEGGRFAKGPASSFVLVAADRHVQRLLAVAVQPEPAGGPGTDEGKP